MKSILILLVPGLVSIASAQVVNSWTKPGSGSWEEQGYWSLEALPDATQSVMFTNAGWKALAIGANTAQNFPQSMQIQGLAITAPVDSYNTLLMNFCGFEQPLQTTSLAIGTNCAVVVQGSVLEVTNTDTSGTTGNIYLGGTFSHGDYSFVKVHGGTRIGTFSGSGAYYLTNGTLSVNSSLSVGDFAPGKFVQYGGSNNAGSITLGGFMGGSYDLYGGQVTATNGILAGDGDYATGASFNQFGGNVIADMTIGGRYYLYGGTVTGRMAAPGSSQRVNASIYQGGGTNFAKSMDLSHPNKFGGVVSYVLTNGVVHVDSSTIFRGGWFYQYNGQHTVVSNFVMQGVYFGGLGHIYAEYLLAGGTLSVGNLTEPADAHFNQTGGTNLIAGELTVSGFLHYDDSSYNLDGGTLAVKNISIGTNSYFQHLSGIIIHSGILTLAQGAWYAAMGSCSLGPLQLGAPNTNSMINFPGGSSILRLANSSALSWASGAILSITGWHGSTSGGGATQLYFGSNSNGLTSQQLSQIQFSVSSNLYPAKILATGEVVPDQGSSTSGPVNSWINPTSGNWDQASNWSLGVLPGSSQLVMITNSASKAVAINPSTPTNFPDSMTVSNLTVRCAFGGATNTLLLNNFGTAVPLTVSNGLTLEDNAQILNFNSGLVVQGGTIIVANSQINQDGGFVRTTNSPMYLQNAAYNLTNGVFEGGQVLLGLPVSARFNQYGGTAVISSLYFGRGPSLGAGGNYALYGGNLSLPNGLLLIGDGNSSSSYLQAGGTNRTPKVEVEDGFLKMTLNGGLLADNDVDVIAGWYGTATLEQNGGTHVITNALSIAGGASTGASVRPATYSLNGGKLSAGVIELNANQGDSVFVQSNGTITADTVYAHSLGYFGSFNDYITLAGGSLSCSNFTLDDGRGSFNQSGGALVVSNLLTITGYRDLNLRYYGSYTFTGGTVTASNINLAADWVIGDGSTNRISNPGFFNLSHTLQISNAVEQLGRFILASSSNATINLAGNASRLSFANSSGKIWAGGATLVVANWNGNLSGGGAEQLKFGTSQSGLTPAQLAQIQFANPAGMAAGNYPARILPTGEVVPTQLLTLSRSGNTLTLTWAPGWTLQSSTNVAGPYQDVQGAASPYPAAMDKPRQFFRLHQ